MIKSVKRYLEKPEVTATTFQIGRLKLVKCGEGGWIKIEMNGCHSGEPESELLPPRPATALKSWLMQPV